MEEAQVVHDDDVVEMEGEEETGEIGFGELTATSSAGSTNNGVMLLPMPVRLEQKRTSRSLMSAVRGYFYPAYNTNSRFRRHLASVGNDDSVTLNRMFDRFVSVSIIRDMARTAKDSMTAEAPEGLVYQCLVHIMRGEKLGLKLRREQYRLLTHQHQAAE
jgi:hypothetical protein